MTTNNTQTHTPLPFRLKTYIVHVKLAQDILVQQRDDPTCSWSFGCWVPRWVYEADGTAHVAAERTRERWGQEKGANTEQEQAKNACACSVEMSQRRKIHISVSDADVDRRRRCTLYGFGV